MYIQSTLHDACGWHTVEKQRVTNGQKCRVAVQLMTTTAVVALKLVNELEELAHRHEVDFGLGLESRAGR